MPQRSLRARVLSVSLVIVLAVVSFGSRPLTAQQAVITAITIKKKAGQPDGKAMATVKGQRKVKGQLTPTEKQGSVASHVVAAWPILNGQAALLLLSPAPHEKLYRVRYYQLDAGKGRLLGYVPFQQATMIENNTGTAASSGPWSFVLSGTDPATGHATVVVGDAAAIHARLQDASEPRFLGPSLAFKQSGRDQQIETAQLLGLEAAGRIYQPLPADAATRYLQFLPDGSSLAQRNDGTLEPGRWLTDGSQFQITTPDSQTKSWPLAALQPVSGLPAESRLTVRLLQPLSSRTATTGTQVKAVLISPGVFDSHILLPQGSIFTGNVVSAHGVNWGIRHESAAITLHFDLVALPGGQSLPIDARVYKVENAREDVTSKGKIQGIRSTGTLGHTAENQIASLAQIDPIAYLFTSSSGSAVFGFAEPEILYNAGTELDLQLNRAIITAQTFPVGVPQWTPDPSQQNQFASLVKTIPFRTRTEITHVPSDITNLIFIGSPQALRAAFVAAGWTSADALTAAATFQTVKTLAGNQTYTQAPMSVLILGDDKPLFTLQKTTNTFSSRHHLRVFQTGETFDGQPVLTASSTQDIGIAFSYKQKTFIHAIDQYLDNERSKVTNDLEFTGCVASIARVPRPWVPKDAYNSTGDRLITDGDAAVLRLNNCAAPHATATTAPNRAPLFERSERNTALTIKDTLYRGNLIYTGINGAIKVRNYLKTSGELQPDEGNWRKSDASGTEYQVGGAPHALLRRRQFADLSSQPAAALDPDARARVEAHKWDPPHFEIGLNLGYSNYRNRDLEITLVDLQSSDKSKPEYVIGLGDAVGDGWAAGIHLTLNTWNWVSNEFAYTRQQTKFELASVSTTADPEAEPAIDAVVVGWTTRRFSYNTLVNLRPRKSRWRPYISAGPAIQLLALSEAPLKKPNGFFRLGLSNIGLIKAAFDFGNTAPLDGGGIFQFALQYGAGLKYRVTPRVMLRADYGETFSANPKIIRDSYQYYEPEGLDETYTTTVTYLSPAARYIQQRATLGVAFTF